ncbi:putative HMG1 protein [Lentinula boryana]|uniref:HMG1 protein n=1 Tax=Lentinula boryana TaxID=40481 RepID=A0ABQ8QAP7_9AGAR|nr:putative HMG1 protein [Lentinula boryana]
MSSAISRRQMSPDFKSGYVPDSSPSLLNFDDPHRFMPADDQMLFGPFEMEDVSFTHDASSIPFPWDSSNDNDSDIKPAYYTARPSPLSTSFDYLSQASPSDSYYDPSVYLTHEDSTSLDNNLFRSWINEPELIPISSPVVPIPISPNDSQDVQPFFTFGERSHFPQDQGFSPSEFAALHPLPLSPSSSYEDSYAFPRQRVDSMTSISPADISAVQTPEWVSGLFDNTATPSSVSIRTPVSSRPSVRLLQSHLMVTRNVSECLDVDLPRLAIYFNRQAQSRSASSMASRRAESVSLSDDRDATVRRRRKVSNSSAEDHEKADKPSDSVPTKSALRPPKLAPSAWQLYFTDWIQRQQASNTRKLNVAQAAKEAGQEYASLSAEEKEPYKRRSQQMKEAREREHAAYMRTLTPDDIKRENVFRAAQRKAGKSRKSNIKDPNAPKKPLSAYFMFLQRIRANPRLVQEVFGDESETTKQSVLAAAKWRSMTDDERKPFLAQAEQEKMEYENARRIYEEGTTGYGTSISFSILPGSPIYPAAKLESESESDSGSAADGFHHRF